MGKTEAVLFAGGEPVALDRIAQVLGVRTSVIESAVSALQEKYNTRTAASSCCAWETAPSSAPIPLMPSRFGTCWI